MEMNNRGMNFQNMEADDNLSQHPVEEIYPNSPEDVNGNFLNGELLDAERRSQEPPAPVYSNWHQLPTLVLEHIFYFLPPADRYNCSLVCRNWYSAFYSPHIWDNYVVDDRFLKRGLVHNSRPQEWFIDLQYMYQFYLSIGDIVRGLELRPIRNLQEVYHFMILVTGDVIPEDSAKVCFGLDNACRNVRRFVFAYPPEILEFPQFDDVYVFRTIGLELKLMRKFLSRLKCLHTLKLFGYVVMDTEEACHLLDDIVKTSSHSMKSLALVNLTVGPCPLDVIAQFPNLTTLVISPQNLDSTVLTSLSSIGCLKDIVLLQNIEGVAPQVIESCSRKAWNTLKAANKAVRVHLRIECDFSDDIITQPEAPVYSITYSSPCIRVNHGLLLTFINQYKDYLTIFGHEGIPKFPVTTAFTKRTDAFMVLLSAKCTKLETLIIREQISTCTVLLIATKATNLRKLYIRKANVVERCDWPRHPAWSKSFYHWLQHHCRTLAGVEKILTRKFGYPWNFLGDREFGKVSVLPVETK